MFPAANAASCALMFSRYLSRCSTVSATPLLPMKHCTLLKTAELSVPVLPHGGPLYYILAVCLDQGCQITTT